jgi:hypothetical protein
VALLSKTLALSRRTRVGRCFAFSATSLEVPAAFGHTIPSRRAAPGSKFTCVHGLHLSRGSTKGHPQTFKLQSIPIRTPPILIRTQSSPAPSAARWKYGRVKSSPDCDSTVEVGFVMKNGFLLLLFTFTIGITGTSFFNASAD